MTDVQIMSVSFEELESGAPAINFCSEFTVPISSKIFAKSFISFYDNDLRFRIEGLTGNKLKLSWYNEEEGILKVFFKNEFVGYVLCGELYNAFVNVYRILSESE